jgi:hypothetical protein
MKAARELVTSFKHSSQAEAILLGKQQAGRAVKPIQDVETRWWSTYSMCSHLKRLRPYLELMELEGTLKCNLNVPQWKVVEDTCEVLEPYMCAQRLMEGENYVTISMYPYILHKVRLGLMALLDRPTSAQVLSLARKLNILLEGTGVVVNLTLLHRYTSLLVLGTDPKEFPK